MKRRKVTNWKKKERKKERKKETKKCKDGQWIEKRKAEMKVDERRKVKKWRQKNMKGIESRKYRKWKQKGKDQLDLFHTTRDLLSLKSSWNIPCRSIYSLISDSSMHFLIFQLLHPTLLIIERGQTAFTERPNFAIHNKPFKTHSCWRAFHLSCRHHREGRCQLITRINTIFGTWKLICIYY